MTNELSFRIKAAQLQKWLYRVKTVMGRVGKGTPPYYRAVQLTLYEHGTRLALDAYGANGYPVSVSMRVSVGRDFSVATDIIALLGAVKMVTKNNRNDYMDFSLSDSGKLFWESDSGYHGSLIVYNDENLSSPMESVPVDTGIWLPSDTVSVLLNKIVPAATKKADSYGSVTENVLIIPTSQHTAGLVATDGFRLHYAPDVELLITSTQTPVSIRSDALQLLKRVMPASSEFGIDLINFGEWDVARLRYSEDDGSIAIDSRPQQGGKYPDWRYVLDAHVGHMDIGFNTYDLFSDAIREAGRAGAKRVKIVISHGDDLVAGGATVSFKTHGSVMTVGPIATSPIRGLREGDELTLYHDVQQLIDVLPDTTINSETGVLWGVSISEDMGNVIQFDNVTYLVMGLRGAMCDF